jgi:hypothetical protein
VCCISEFFLQLTKKVALLFPDEEDDAVEEADTDADTEVEAVTGSREVRVSMPDVGGGALDVATVVVAGGGLLEVGLLVGGGGLLVVGC